MCGQMIMTMLAEIVLCVKEVNSKTRAAAFEVLLDLAHAMESADPASAVPDDDVDMGNPCISLPTLHMGPTWLSHMLGCAWGSHLSAHMRWH
jgi:hypothetical protein